MPRKGPAVLKALALILLLALIAAGIGLRGELDREILEAHIQALGLWAPAAFIVAYALAALAFLPGLVFTIAGGALFGPLLGTLYSLIGATAGATLAFLAARHLAGDWVRRRTGARLERLQQGIDREGWRFVAFVRLVPLFPFNLLNYALGLTRIRLGAYALTSFLCMTPGALAYAWVGHAGASAVAGGRSGIQAGLIALGLVAAVIFLPRLVRRLKRDPSQPSAPRPAERP